MAESAALIAYRPLRPCRRRRIRLRGLDYQLSEWGEPEGRPLVLLHGWMDCGLTWQFLVDALGTERWIVAPDWRGFGDSDWAPHGYWFPDYLADLDALLEQLLPEGTVDLVGHSMGGNVAGLYAGVRPERVRRLALLEGFGLQPPPAEEAPQRYRRWLDQLRETPRIHQPDSFDALARRLMQRNPRLNPQRAAFIARAWARQLPDGSLQLRGDPRHKWVNPILYRLAEAQACWRRITAPCLWLWGSESRLLSLFEDPAAWQERVGCFSDWRGLPIPAAGHMLQHDQPQAVAQALEAFLA